MILIDKFTRRFPHGVRRQATGQAVAALIFLTTAMLILILMLVLPRCRNSTGFIIAMYHIILAAPQFVLLKRLMLSGAARAYLLRECIECGYSLKMAPDNQRCPECGHVYDPEDLRDKMDRHAGVQKLYADARNH